MIAYGILYLIGCIFVKFRGASGGGGFPCPAFGYSYSFGYGFCYGFGFCY